MTTSQNAGKTFSKAVRLGTDQWKLNACPMDGGSLAATDVGQLTTVWRRDKQLIRTDTARAGEQLLGTGRQPWVAGTRKGAYIVWLGSRNDALWFSAPNGRTPRRLGIDANDPTIAAPVVGNGPVVVVWETGQEHSTSIMAAVVAR